MRDSSSWVVPSPLQPSTSSSAFPRVSASKTPSVSSTRIPLSNSVSNAPRLSIHRRLSTSSPYDKENNNEGLEGQVLWTSSPKDTLSLSSACKGNCGSESGLTASRLLQPFNSTDRKLFLSPPKGPETGNGPHKMEEEAETQPPLPSSKSASTSFHSGKAFWLNLMEAISPQSQQTSSDEQTKNAYTPLGRMIQKTWTAGSPLSDASAYEIDTVDQQWKSHLEEIHSELEQFHQEVTLEDYFTNVQTPSASKEKEDEELMSIEHQATNSQEVEVVLSPTVQQARSCFERHSKQAAARQSWLSVTSTEVSSKDRRANPRDVPSSTNGKKISPSSTTSPLTYIVEPFDNQKTTDGPEEGEETPITQFQWARQSLGLASEGPRTGQTASDTVQGDERKSKSQFERARKILNVVKQESSEKSTASPHVKLSIENVGQNNQAPNESTEDRNAKSYCLATPKNEWTEQSSATESVEQEGQVSQFEWARQNLNLSGNSHRMKTPQTAPAKLRLPSKPRASSEASDTGANASPGFKNLLHAWQRVNGEKSSPPTFLSPATAAKTSSRVASTTTKLPPPVSACPSLSSIRSTVNAECEDAETIRMARMVESYQGYQYREKPQTSVLAMGRKVTNRYVDSDFYERASPGGGDLSRALVILENNDIFQITLGNSNPKGTKTQGGDDLKIRDVELVHSYNLDLAMDACECSGSVFSGNDDLISFFLPQMGMACTCGKRKNVGFVNPENPTAIENVLRPWQVSFLESMGITTSDQLVKARQTSAPILAKGLKQWRRNQNMIEFKTSSCSMAIDIWAKTAKVYARSIRKQIEAGQILLESRPDEVMAELARFVGELPSAPKRRGDFAVLEFDPESEMEV